MNKRIVAAFLPFLVVFAICRFATLGILPLVDPSEGRYAQVALRIAETNDFVIPKIWYRGELLPYMQKPPLFFWGAAAFIKFFGKNEIAVRLTAFLSAAAILAIMYFAASRRLGRKTAFFAVAILASSGGFFFLSGAVLGDMTLCLCSSGAYFFYYAFLMAKERRRKKAFSVLVFIFLGLGMLAKGPVAIVMFGLPVFCWTAYNRKWATLKDHAWIVGGFCFAATWVPWFVLAEIKTPGYLHYFFVNENLLRYVTHDYGDLFGHGHEKPYGMSIAYFLEVSSPWSGFILLFLLWNLVASATRLDKPFLKSLVKRVASALNVKRDEGHYFLFGFAAIVLFLCFARQLLPYYLLYALPAFAVWAALLIRQSDISARLVFITASLLTVIYACALGIISQMDVMNEDRSTERIISAVSTELDKAGATGEFIFTPDIPNSAYFYGGDKIVSHTPERIQDTLADRKNLANSDLLYFVRRKYFERLGPEEFIGFNEFLRDDQYVVLRKAN